MGGNRSFLGINREMRRGKRGIFSSNVTGQIAAAVCNSCSCQMCPSTTPVPAQLQFSSHAPSGRRALPWLRLAGFQGACTRQGWINHRQGSGKWGEAEPGGSCLAALPSQHSQDKVTPPPRDSARLCLATGSPCTHGCSRREQRGIWEQQEPLCQC